MGLRMGLNRFWQVLAVDRSGEESYVSFTRSESSDPESYADQVPTPLRRQVRGSPVSGSLGLVGQVHLTGRYRWCRAASRKRKQLQDGKDVGKAQRTA